MTMALRITVRFMGVLPPFERCVSAFTKNWR
jgi:hypothetical protein